MLRVCLHTLRILSRDCRALGPLVCDKALFTLAHLGGILQNTAEDEGRSGQTPGCRETAEADGVPPTETPAVSFSAATHTSPVYSSRRRGAEERMLVPGTKEAREEDSEDEEREEDGEVCRKEAMKVLCNIIYNSPRAQERASTLR